MTNPASANVPARQSAGSCDQLIEQFAEDVAGDNRFAVRLGDTGLPGAEPLSPGPRPSYQLWIAGLVLFGAIGLAAALAAL